jgi:hypothetical protein
LIDTARAGDDEGIDAALAAVAPQVKRGCKRTPETRHRRPEVIYLRIKFMMR